MIGLGETVCRLPMLFKLTTQEKKAVALVTLLIVLGIAGYWLL